MGNAPQNLSRRDFVLCAAGFATLGATAGADLLLNQGLSNPEEVAAGVAKLNALPTTIGAWTSAPGSIDERELRLGEIAGYFRREFRHAETGRAVVVTILCGASGPLSVHPPTACFEGVGYSLVAGPTVTGITDETNATVSLNKASFRLRDIAAAEVVRVFWGWSEDGEWDAPGNPRVSYRGRSVLFKLYTVDRAYETADDLAQSEAFLKDALPIFRRILQSPPGTTSGPAFDPAVKN